MILFKKKIENCQNTLAGVSKPEAYASSLWYKLSEIRITGLIISPNIVNIGFNVT